MKLEKIGVIEIVAFGVVVSLFIFFGQSVGWRAVGILQLVFSLKVLRERRIGVGWEGFAPSFYIDGALAVLLGMLSVGIAVMLLFYPEQTVMKLGS